MIFWQPMTNKVPQPNSNDKSLESTETKYCQLILKGFFIAVAQEKERRIMEFFNYLSS